MAPVSSVCRFLFYLSQGKRVIPFNSFSPHCRHASSSLTHLALPCAGAAAFRFSPPSCFLLRDPSIVGVPDTSSARKPDHLEHPVQMQQWEFGRDVTRLGRVSTRGAKVYVTLQNLDRFLRRLLRGPMASHSLNISTGAWRRRATPRCAHHIVVARSPCGTICGTFKPLSQRTVSQYSGLQYLCIMAYPGVSMLPLLWH